MAILEIVKHPDDRLRRRARPVVKLDRRLRKLIADMIETMRDAAGLGLAGPQVGRGLRLFVYEDEDDRAEALINPEIVRSSGRVIGSEGCLSIPRLHGDVARAKVIEITGLDRRGRRVHREVEGMLARVFQHEIDHLDGILFTDRADPETLHYLTDEEEAERLARREGKSAETELIQPDRAPALASRE